LFGPKASNGRNISLEYEGFLKASWGKLGNYSPPRGPPNPSRARSSEIRGKEFYTFQGDTTPGSNRQTKNVPKVGFKVLHGGTQPISGRLPQSKKSRRVARQPPLSFRIRRSTWKEEVFELKKKIRRKKRKEWSLRDSSHVRHEGSAGGVTIKKRQHSIFSQRGKGRIHGRRKTPPGSGKGGGGIFSNALWEKKKRDAQELPPQNREGRVHLGEVFGFPGRVGTRSRSLTGKKELSS